MWSEFQAEYLYACQSMALDNSTKFKLEILIRKTISVIRKFRDILENSLVNPLVKQPPGPRLSIKTVYPTYGDSYVKDKTVVNING